MSTDREQYELAKAIIEQRVDTAWVKDDSLTLLGWDFGYNRRPSPDEVHKLARIIIDRFEEVQRLARNNARVKAERLVNAILEVADHYFSDATKEAMIERAISLMQEEPAS